MMCTCKAWRIFKDRCEVGGFKYDGQTFLFCPWCAAKLITDEEYEASLPTVDDIQAIYAEAVKPTKESNQ
jgi:hypothetical protein